MEVVIIRLTPYREKDYIINALSKEEGIITFRAPGALNVKSKFAGKLFLYALVDIELRESKAGHTLTNVESLTNMAKVFTDPKRIIALNVVGEVISKTLKDDASITETFTLIKNTLHALSETSKLISLMYLFITNLLRILGSGLVIDRCVSCGDTKNIIGVAFNRGGLICKSCYDDKTTKLTGSDIQILRYGFMISEAELLRHEFSDNEALSLLNLMLMYLEFTYNIKIMSKDLIK
ncbi:MAG: DNA repair protein RecO [Tenericutes bacterium ADurb.Bin087]|nr:MAG: DNA repair protein RecO [Tenericutes bacterium ADurb.Bin087]